MRSMCTQKLIPLPEFPEYIIQKHQITINGILYNIHPS